MIEFLRARHSGRRTGVAETVDVKSLYPLPKKAVSKLLGFAVVRIDLLDRLPTNVPYLVTDPRSQLSDRPRSQCPVIILRVNLVEGVVGD